MDYGVIGADVREYLHDMIGSTPPQISDEFTTIMDLYARKLWHELTLRLEVLVKSAYFDEVGSGLKNLYAKFIRDFQDRINQLSLVNIALSILRQYSDPAEAIAFLESLKPKVVRNNDAFLTLVAGIAEIHIQIGDLATAKKELDEVQKLLENVQNVGAPHAAYYRVISDYYKRTADFQGFYENALKFLGCIELNTLSQDAQSSLAFDLGLAAMISPKIYNFGELLAHPILDSLKTTDKAWLTELLFAFNSGNIEKFTALKPQWSSEGDLVGAYPALREKLSLLAIMEMVFRCTARDRGLSFADIANTTQTAHNDVEVLLMKALSLGLVRGTIDEVAQRANFVWVQPRVLDLDQLNAMSERLRAWTVRIKAAAADVEAQTPELFQGAFL